MSEDPFGNKDWNKISSLFVGFVVTVLIVMACIHWCQSDMGKKNVPVPPEEIERISFPGTSAGLPADEE